MSLRFSESTSAIKCIMEYFIPESFLEAGDHEGYDFYISRIILGHGKRGPWDFSSLG